LQVENGKTSAKHNPVVGSGPVSFASSGRTRTATFLTSSGRARIAVFAQNAEPLTQGRNAHVLLGAALNGVLRAFLVG
jgi:hypothetical protein